jgi:hypothetical protein
MTCQHPPDGDSSAAERIYHAFTPHFAPFVIHTTYPIFWNAKTSVDRHWSRDFLLHPHNEFCFLYRKVTTELTLALIWATPWPRLVQHFSRHRFATLLKKKKPLPSSLQTWQRQFRGLARIKIYLLLPRATFCA